MRCVNPRRLPNPAATGIDDAFIQAGCGKCYACLSNRRRGWLFRLYHEHINSLFSLFVTFTYDDVCMPSDQSLHKEHLQKFFKKLRHYDEFTYYAIGEYGTTTFRPHYHAIIFFKSSSDCSILDYYELVNRLWSFGFTYCCRVNYRRLNYVLHYHTRPKEPIQGKKTFQIFSKGLGIGFLDDNCIDYLVHSGKTTVRDFNGNLYVVPRYYRKKLTELGYNLPAVTITDKDYTVQRIEKVFHKKIYEISTIKVAGHIRDLVRKSNIKISKYNNQDKFI